MTSSQQNTIAKEQVSNLAHRTSELLRQRKFEQAEVLCKQLTSDYATAPEGWLLWARSRQQQGDLDGMADHSLRAEEYGGKRFDVQLLRVDADIVTADVASALRRLDDLVASDPKEAAVWDRIIALYTQLNQHDKAYSAAKHFAALSPSSLAGPLMISNSAFILGRLDEAEELLNNVIKAEPRQADAFYNRAILKRQTKSENHLDELKVRLKTLAATDPAIVPICYALAKELEDLGQINEAFGYLKRGADERRKRMAYDVRNDVNSLDHIKETFSKKWAQTTPDGFGQEGPIFILGLPRSGTTLVERILDQHSQVTGLGEVNDLAYAVMRAGGGLKDKSQLIARTASANMGDIGQTFWQAVNGYGASTPYLIDKTPANFLYLGLVAKALPNARIIHVKRHPMDSGYAMYKTLFRMGYPFSYDLKDIAEYYIAYDRLMSHWHKLFPNRILDVHYEALVQDQETISREIINYCGLNWQDDCLDFHESSSPSATASAVQVRQPIYKTSVAKWQKLESELEPLRKHLEEGGLILP